MEKLMIPKKVADALEELRDDGDSNSAILTYVLSESNHRSVSLLRGYFEDNFDDLMSVLVNGYEIKLSPEEAVFNYYHNCRAAQISALEKSDWNKHTYWETHIIAIRNTLGLLGKKIKGVNTSNE